MRRIPLRPSRIFRCPSTMRWWSSRTPRGQGLHVGHPRTYTALDIVARKKRLCGL